MKTFYLLLKSGTDYPDYEDTVQADSKNEAVRYFYHSVGKYGYDRETIGRYTEEL